VGFTTDEVTLWQAFRGMPSLSTLCIIPKILNTHISFIYSRLFITLAFDSCNIYFTFLSNSSSLWNINHKIFSFEIKYINNSPTRCNTKQSDIYWTVNHCDNWRIRNQLDATCYFIVLLVRSTCFEHYYAIIRSSHLCCWLPHWSYCSWFAVCWRWGVVRLE